MIDHPSPCSVLTSAPATRREPTTDRLDCARCEGVGHHDGPGPLSTPCSACAGTGGARCRDCASPATVRDADTAELGPACADCATRCAYDCGATSVRHVETVDDSGEPSVLALCAVCAEEEPARIERVLRQARAALEDDGRGDWMRACQRDVEVA